METIATDPHILALATSGTWCSVAMYRPIAGGMESHCISEPGQARQSENILAMVDEVCRAAGLDPAALDAIAFDAGPGSFTGLRIACAVAQGLGFALDIPLLPVGSLRALAWQRVRLESARATVFVSSDARMSERYMAAYRLRAPEAGRHETDAARLEVVHEPVIVPQAQFDALVEAWSRQSRSADHGAPIVQAGDAWPPPTGDSTVGARHLRVEAMTGSGDGVIRADAVAELARVDWCAGRAMPAGAAAPFYLRDKVALDLEEQRAARA